MKKYHYNHLLEQHGYKPVINTPHYAHFSKKYGCNEASFFILKDNHKKGIVFNYRVQQNEHDDGKNLADHGRQYLLKEASLLKEQFMKLGNLD